MTREAKARRVLFPVLPRWCDEEAGQLYVLGGQQGIDMVAMAACSSSSSSLGLVEGWWREEGEKWL